MHGDGTIGGDATDLGMYFLIGTIPFDGDQATACIHVDAVVIDGEMGIVAAIGLVDYIFSSARCIHPAKQVFCIIIPRIKGIPEFLVRRMHIYDPIPRQIIPG